MAWWAKTILPKTGETNLLMVRAIKFGHEQEMENPWDFSQDTPTPQPVALGQDPSLLRHVGQAILHHSMLWIVGSSLAFEAVLLALAATLFCRRDY